MQTDKTLEDKVISSVTMSKLTRNYEREVAASNSKLHISLTNKGLTWRDLVFASYHAPEGAL